MVTGLFGSGAALFFVPAAVCYGLAYPVLGPAGSARIAAMERHLRGRLQAQRGWLLAVLPVASALAATSTVSAGGVRASSQAASGPNLDPPTVVVRATGTPLEVMTHEVSRSDWLDHTALPLSTVFIGSMELPLENLTGCDAMAFANSWSAGTHRAPAYTCMGESDGFLDCCITGASVAVDLDVDGWRLPTLAEWEAIAGAALTYTKELGK
jgi:hypothetical protein